MKAKYKGKTVKVTKLITRKEEYITYPIIVQARIEYKDENGLKCSNYVNGNDIKFD
jgi:hypothetical protein